MIPDRQAYWPMAWLGCDCAGFVSTAGQGAAHKNEYQIRASSKSGGSQRAAIAETPSSRLFTWQSTFTRFRISPMMK